MTKRVFPSVRRSVTGRAYGRALPGLFAFGLVLLQLATALHFALIPHAFGPGLSGLEHVHHALEARATERSPDRPSFVTGVRSGEPEACPIGFSGPVSVLLAQPGPVARVALPAPSPRLPRVALDRCRTQLLLNAPKTSPPRAS